MEPSGLLVSICGEGLSRVTRPEAAAAPKRERLNRSRVLEAAVELADRVGYDNLSMRSLADQLGVVPMAIYKHVVDKDDLLAGMLDIVIAEVQFPRDVGWRVAMRERALAMRQTLLRHPWAVGRFEGVMPGPSNLNHHNEFLGCLREEAGFPFRTALHAYSVLESYIHGYALQERSLPAHDIPHETQRRRATAVQRDPSFEVKHPHLVELVEELTAGWDSQVEFEVGLDLILDGLERLREAENGNRPRSNPRVNGSRRR